MNHQAEKDGKVDRQLLPRTNCGSVFVKTFLCHIKLNCGIAATILKPELMHQIFLLEQKIYIFDFCVQFPGHSSVLMRTHHPDQKGPGEQVIYPDFFFFLLIIYGIQASNVGQCGIYNLHRVLLAIVNVLLFTYHFYSETFCLRTESRFSITNQLIMIMYKKCKNLDDSHTKFVVTIITSFQQFDSNNKYFIK